ncbi:UNVERIFIED_ORG: hypothetical protein J2Y77_002213 [Pseudomonas lini]
MELPISSMTKRRDDSVSDINEAHLDGYHCEFLGTRFELGSHPLHRGGRQQTRDDRAVLGLIRRISFQQQAGRAGSGISLPVTRARCLSRKKSSHDWKI